MDLNSYLSLNEKVEIQANVNPEQLAIRKEVLDRMSFKAQLVLKYIIAEDLNSQRAIKRRCRRDKWTCKSIEYAMEELRSALKEISSLHQESQVIFLNPGQNNI